MKITLITILLLLLFGTAFIAFKYKLNKDISQPVNTTVARPVISVAQVKHLKPETRIKTSLFVPYWTLTNEKIDSSGFESFIYFGIKPDKQGISMTETEAKNLEKFNGMLFKGSRKLLALRMTNSQGSVDILSKPLLQREIIDQTIQITQENNMQGVVLDLEVSAIPFDSLTQSINKFTSEFYTSVKKARLTFSLALYGDTLYRARPYEVKTLAQNADSIMIMAYDLNKPNGNPGPNFPLGGQGKFGYDLTKMTDDFLQFVPSEKASVIFGLFGYDWVVDEKGKGIEEARALTLSQIRQKFINPANQDKFINLVLSRDNDAGELQIQYLDAENKRHIVWFEDMESIKQKQEYLKSRGINSYSYWAYSYF